MTARLPNPGGDTNQWGTILNTFLGVSLAADGTLSSPAVQAAAGLTVTGVKTANYTANPYEFVPMDTTSNNLTLTLPTAPTNGTRIGVKMVVQPGTNIITVQTGGTDVFNVAAGSTTSTLKFLGEAKQYQYNSSTGIWYTLTDSASNTVHTSGVETITGVKTINAGWNWGSQTFSGGGTLVDGTAPLVLTNTSTGAFTLNLPPTPTLGSWFLFADLNASWNTHNLTIGRSGRNIDGAATNQVLAANGGAVLYVYDGTGWHSQNYPTAGGDLQGNFPNPTLKSSINLLGSPTLNTTPSQDDNSQKIIDSAWYSNQRGTATPLANGTGNAGTSDRWASIDHVHPTSVSSGVTGFVDAFSLIQGVTPGTSGNPQTALQVTANGSYTLSIAAGSALVQGTDANPQPMYALTQATTASLVMGTGAPISNPRVDAIVVQFNDAGYTGRTPVNSFSFVQVVGTPTAGANLTNLSGAPALPASSLLLAYTLATVGGGGVINGNVLDKRVLSGPGVWGEDGHRYRIGIDASGNIYHGQVM